MPPQTNNASRLQSITFYLLLAAVVLSPLVFWPSQYFALEAVKTIVIGVLTVAGFITTAMMAVKEKTVKLPPKSILWIGTLLSLSLLVSSFASGHFAKSFFGQGFELGAGGFILTLLLASLVGYFVTLRDTSRVVVLYTGMVAAFLILWIFQVVRLIAGPNFASLGILNSTTSTIFGSWFALAGFAAFVALMSLLAIKFLTLSKKIKIGYIVLAVLAGLTVVIANSTIVWQATALVFLGLTIYMTSQNPRGEGSKMKACMSRIAWLPLVITVVSVVFAWQGLTIVGPVLTKINAGYTELSLPWRMTIDVVAGELKQNPLLGSGPNRFGQAYLSYKPNLINATDAWGVEFNSGFSLASTFLVTQGLVGGIIWTLFFIFFGILGVKSLRGLLKNGDSLSSVAEGERPYAKFVLISSYAGAALVWLLVLTYVPTHVVLAFGFILTGIWLGASVAYGRLSGVVWSASGETKSGKLYPMIGWVVIILVLCLGIVHIKNAAALSYFGQGVKQLTKVGNAEVANAKFAKAVALNPLDIYLQGRAEASISEAKLKISGITSTTTASTSEALLKDAVALVNQAMEFANAAVRSDNENYNNYISQARVGEVANAMRVTNGYESAEGAYSNAIARNPQNPSIYLSLARLQASANQLDKAIQTVGAALQVKNNYLDAVFLLSQVEAAKGNLADAVTAASFATQLNPTNALLFFQLGLLQYTKGDYAPAMKSLEEAIKLEANYANAQYFLGLSYARLGNTEQAIAQFEKLDAANPGNQDVATILSTLRSGRSLFAAPVTTPTAAAARPEKRATPPIPVK